MPSEETEAMGERLCGAIFNLPPSAINPVAPRRLTLTRREIGALLAAGNLSYHGVTLLVEEGPGSIDLSNRSEAEVERLHTLLRRTLGYINPGTPLRETLRGEINAALAPSPDDRGGERRITTAHRVTEHDGEVVVEPPIKPGLSICRHNVPDSAVPPRAFELIPSVHPLSPNRETSE